MSIATHITTGTILKLVKSSRGSGRMTAGEEECARPSGAPGLFRTRLDSARSLSRQRRFRSVEDLHVQMHSSFDGSMQSIPDLSHSSAQSTSPVGDYPEQVNIGQASVLQKAAWFLQNRQQEDNDKSRVLINMGRTIQRTGTVVGSQLRKTRLYHIFYVLAVPLYNILGAVLFQALDGEHDDRMLKEYQSRCQGDRVDHLAVIQRSCQSGGDCFNLMKIYMEQVEKCYRDWHTANRTITHSMNDFSNAMVYAFSVYTTIGYGNMAADTLNCRLATIIYGAFGIPLFFAFVKEAGALLRVVFISAYNKINTFWKRICTCNRKKDDVHTTILSAPKEADLENGSSNSSHTQPVILISETESKRARFARKYSTGSLFGQHGKLHLHEQRRVFIAGVVIFIAYLLLLSSFIMWYTEFDYFTSVYFLFNSVALIGFGDVFPKEPWIMLISQPFIVFGVTLFSMCYFILQEEIRHRALEASRKARKSISKYSHTIMQHSRSAWSRRNSPLLEGGSPTESAFDRMRKRRQSAPAVTLTVPPR